MEILENAKDIYNLIKKLDQQDLLEKMADLRDQILELREENQKLKEKILELETENKYVVLENGSYFKIRENEKKEGPFCSVCWEKDRKLISLKSHYTLGSSPDNIPLRCPVCKTIHKQ